MQAEISFVLYNKSTLLHAAQNLVAFIFHFENGLHVIGSIRNMFKYSHTIMLLQRQFLEIF